MPEAQLGGVVEAEGAIGQPHPGEDKAGSSTQESQLGEHHGDECLQGTQKLRGDTETRGVTETLGG